MPSNHTENHQLSQWEATDQVKREDFNADNAKIDAAMKAETDARTAGDAVLQTAVNTKGNCRIAAGTYTGNGKYDYNNPVVLDFASTLGKAPELLIVRGTYGGAEALILLRGMTSSFYTLATSWSSSGSSTVTWTNTGVSWYNSSSSDRQYNSQGTKYHYIAIG